MTKVAVLRCTLVALVARLFRPGPGYFVRPLEYPCIENSVFNKLVLVWNLFYIAFASYDVRKQVSVAGLFRPLRETCIAFCTGNGIAPARNSPG